MSTLLKQVKQSGLALWEVARILDADESQLRRILGQNRLLHGDQVAFEKAITEANYKKYGHIDEFISDNFFVTENTGNYISAKEIYDLYVKWVYKKRPERFPLGNMLFGRYLSKVGIQKIRTSTGYQYICLKRKDV